MKNYFKWSDQNKFLFFVLTTNIAIGIFNILVGKVLYDETGNIMAFGGVLLLEHAGTFLLQGIAGKIADSKDPIKTLPITNILRSLAIIVTGLALIFKLNPIILAVGIIGVNLVAPFFRAAYFCIPKLICPEDEILSFNGKLTSFYQVGQIIGISLAGILLTYLGDKTIFLPSVFLILSCISIFKVKPKKTGSIIDSNQVKIKMNFLIQYVRQVYTFIKFEKRLSWLIFLSVSDFLCVNLINLFLVPLVDQYFNGKEIYLSIFDGGFAIGAILSGFIITYLGKKKIDEYKLSLYSKVIQIFSFSLLMIFPSTVTVFISYFLLGIAVCSSGSIFSSMIQRLGRNEILGTLGSYKFFALSMISGLMIPIISKASVNSLNLAIGISIICLIGFLALQLVNKNAFSIEIKA